MHAPRRPRFDPDLSHAIDRLILAMEACRPAARKPLRVVKRALEVGVPARRGR
jgi:hypothetical protein